MTGECCCRTSSASRTGGSVPASGSTSTPIPWGELTNPAGPASTGSVSTRRSTLSKATSSVKTRYVDPLSVNCTLTTLASMVSVRSPSVVPSHEVVSPEIKHPALVCASMGPGVTRPMSHLTALTSESGVNKKQWYSWTILLLDI